MRPLHGLRATFSFMNAVRGRVRGGHVEIDGALPEGAEVVVLTPGNEEPFDLGEDLLAELETRMIVGPEIGAPWLLVDGHGWSSRDPERDHLNVVDAIPDPEVPTSDASHVTPSCRRDEREGVEQSGQIGGFG
jgi:hypothetical protein